jgi:hypothetical protein
MMLIFLSVECIFLIKERCILVKEEVGGFFSDLMIALKGAKSLWLQLGTK